MNCGMDWRRHIPIETCVFHGRGERTAYVAKRYRDILRGKVLDVGCDQALLRTLVPHVDYTGVDIAGAPDIQVDLERVERLPFSDNEFDCVVCTDVLEHLDNFHFMFAELLRVTKRHVVLSLPNCWAGARVPIERGYGSFAHYGLPVEKPIDRHKWFFSLTDALEFVQKNSTRFCYGVSEAHAMEKPRHPIIRLVRRLRYPNLMWYLNRYAHTIWFHLEKQSPETGSQTAQAP